MGKFCCSPDCGNKNHLFNVPSGKKNLERRHIFLKRLQVPQNRHDKNLFVCSNYKVRAGTKDSGKDYEFRIAALMSLRCSGQDVEDMWLAINAESCGNFDDLIIYRKEIGGSDRTYLMQLKHQDSPKNIVRDQFLSDKGNYSLKKYETSLIDMQSKIDCESKKCGILDYLRHNKNIVPIIFTNNGTTNYSFLKDTHNRDLFLNTKGNAFSFNYEDLGYNLSTNVKEHFKNLYLFTNQIGIAGVNNLIEAAIKALINPLEISSENLNKVSQKYITFIIEWGSGLLGGHYPLTKTRVLKKLVELLLEPYVSKFYEVDRLFNSKFRTKIWDEFIGEQDVSIVDKDDTVVQFLLEYVIHTTTKCEQIRRGEHDYRKVMMRTVSGSEQRTLLNDYEYLWKAQAMPLVLEAINKQNMEMLMGVMSKFSGMYKVILIKHESIVANKSDNLKVFLTLSDLNSDQVQIILNTIVKLQGRSGAKLGEVLKNKRENLTLVSSKDVIHILSNNFNIGNLLNQLPEYFVERFVSKILLRPKILQAATNDLFVIKCQFLEKFQSFIQKNKLDIDDALIQDYKEIVSDCRVIISKDVDVDLNELEKFPKKGIHQLILHDTQELEWVKSLGSTESIRSFRSTSEKINLTPITVNNVEGFYSNRIKLVSAGPGMGKSVLLDYIALQTPTRTWVLRIHLKDYLDYYHSEKFRSSVATDHLKHFNDSVLRKCGCNAHLVKVVFGELLSSKRVLLLFDGFDEIAVGFKREVTKIMHALYKQGFSMWLTTRPVLRKHTEESFDTLSFTLSPFSKKEQFDYLTQFYLKLNSDKSAKKDLIEQFVLQLLDVARKKLDDSDNIFLGIPLHTKLLASLFAQKCATYINTEHFSLNKSFNLISLYETFVKEKIQIFHLKYGKFFGDACKEYERYQQFLALRSLFGEDFQMKTKLSRFVDIMALQLLQADEIVVPVDELDITFAHRTYAEYLAAKWLSENFLHVDNRSTCQYLINKLFDPNYSTVKNLFDKILAKSCMIPNPDQKINQLENTIKHNPAVVNVLDKGGRSILHLVATRGTYHSVPITQDIKYRKNHIISEARIPDALFRNVNVKDKIFDYTPLDYAIASGCLDTADAICSKSENPQLNVSEQHLSSYVYYCAMFGYVFLLEAILKGYEATDVLKEAIDANLQSYNTPLHCATSKNRTEIVGLLLSYGADANSKDFNGMTPLHMACEAGLHDIALILLSNGAAVDRTDRIRFTPLHRAALNGHASIVALLLSSYSLTTNVLKNKFQNRHYQNIANEENDYSYVTTNYIDLKTYVNKTDNDKNSALHFSAMNGHTAIVSLLLSNGADVNLANTRSYTALHLAACKGHTSTVFVLLSKCTTIVNNMSNSSASTTSSYLALMYNTQEYNNLTDSPSSTPLQDAAKAGYAEIVSLLLSCGAHVNLQNTRSFTALHEASRAGRKQIVSTLLNHGADSNIKNSRGSTPLHEAARGGHTGVVSLLMNKMSNVNQEDNGGYTALHEAASKGHSEVVLMLLSNDNTNVNVKSKRSITPLYLATKHGYRNVVSLLLSKSAQVNIALISGFSALHKAAQCGHKEIVSLLLSCGANINLVDSEGRTPLFIACSFDHADVVSLLLAKNAHIEKGNKHGLTALHEASYYGYLNVVSELLIYKARVNVKDSRGKTALHHAVSESRLSIVKELVKYGADVNICDLNSETPLNLAKKLNYLEIIEYLEYTSNPYVQ